MKHFSLPYGYKYINIVFECSTWVHKRYVYHRQTSVRIQGQEHLLPRGTSAVLSRPEGVKRWFVDQFWNTIYDLNCICDREASVCNVFSFYRQQTLFPPKTSHRGDLFFLLCHSSFCQSRCPSISFSPSQWSDLIMERSSSFGPVIGTRLRGWVQKPRGQRRRESRPLETCPRLWP